jgi:hypothetical protein
LRAGREGYVVADGVTDQALVAVCHAVFGVLEPVVTFARIDAYSDYSAQMPDDIRAAELWLRDRGLQSGEVDPASGVLVNRTDEVGWVIVRAFALWSTRTALYDRDGDCLATIEDAGHAIVLELTKPEADAFADRVHPVRLERWVDAAAPVFTD